MDRTPQHRSHDGDVDIEGIARTAEDRHVPVLLDMTVDLLTPALQHPGAVYVDATLGMGGHAAAVLTSAPRPAWWASTVTPWHWTSPGRGSPAPASLSGSPWCTPPTTRSPRSSPSWTCPVPTR